jgi:hypothetical protein
MLQALDFDGVAFDPFYFQQDGLTAPEVDVSRCQVADALVVAEMVVVGDEVADLLLKITGKVIVLEQDAVLERMMPALDLALCRRVNRRPVKMVHAFLLKPVRQIAGYQGVRALHATGGTAADRAGRGINPPSVSNIMLNSPIGNGFGTWVQGGNTPSIDTELKLETVPVIPLVAL